MASSLVLKLPLKSYVAAQSSRKGGAVVPIVSAMAPAGSVGDDHE
jgi:hypothetical protein